MFQLAPGNLRDMQKSVDTAQIYKSAVIGKSHYGTLYNVVNMQAVPYGIDLFLFFLSQDCLV